MTTRMMIRILLIAAVVTATASAQLFRTTSKVGTTAAQFLKIGVGARAIAMGSAQVAVRNDVTALYWNPAAVSRIDAASELTFNHVNWLADVSFDFAGAILDLGPAGTLGFSVTSLSIPDDIVRTVDFPEGDGRRWDAGSLALGVAYAKNLTDRFSIGFHAKYVRESIWSESASAFALDIGTLYVSELPGLTLGASITNFGTRMRLEGRDLIFNADPNNDVGSGPNNVSAQYRTGDFDLPLLFRVGIAYDAVNTEDVRMTAAVDAAHPNDNMEYINSGLEVAWTEVLFLRAGYRSAFQRDAEGGMTWGFGFHYGIVNSVQIKLDYGTADYGRLKSVHYLSLGVRL